MQAIVTTISSPRSAALALGATTVVLTHSYMLLAASEEELADPAMMRHHAVLNLVAGAAVVWGSKLLG